MCTAGFLYVGRRRALEEFLETGDEGQNEMLRLGDYAWRRGDAAVATRRSRAVPCADEAGNVGRHGLT